MTLTFLGTGTSTGVPQIACTCKTCTSVNIKDKRLRTSFLIEEGETAILIDCGPDFRQQMLSHGGRKISALLLTHEHYDHISGLDDIRPMGDLNLFAEKRVIDIVKRNMSYCFGENRYPGVPSIETIEIDEHSFLVKDLTIQPIRVMHADLPILGFRIKNMAYLTDVKSISDESIAKLDNLDVLVLNALRPQQHISHLSLSEATRLARKINARKTYFTHISHDMGLHSEINPILENGMELAFDGLKLNI